MSPKFTLNRLLFGSPLRKVQKKWFMAQVRRSVYEPTPTIGILQIIGGVATLAAYNSTDQLTLRMLFATGTILGGVIPNLARKPTLILPAIWSGLFLSINGSRIAELLMAKVPLTFDATDLKVYETTYYKYLTPNQYKKLLDISHYETVQKGTRLKAENVPSTSLQLIVKGGVRLESVSEEVAVVKAEEPTQPNPFKFIGIPRHLEAPENREDEDGDEDEDEQAKKRRLEEAKETDNTAVEVIAGEETELMVTPLAELKKLLNDNPEMKLGLLTLFHERLLQKVLIRDKSLSVKRYFAMVKVAVSEGVIEGDVKRAIKKFRRDHSISKIQHREALAAVNWTSEDWHAGAKESGEKGAEQGRRGALIKLLHKTRHVTPGSIGGGQAKKVILPSHPSTLHDTVDVNAMKVKKLRTLVSGSFGGSTDKSKMVVIEKPLETQDPKQSTLTRTANIYRRKSRTLNSLNSQRLAKAAKQLGRQRRESISSATLTPKKGKLVNFLDTPSPPRVVGRKSKTFDAATARREGIDLESLRSAASTKRKKNDTYDEEILQRKSFAVNRVRAGDVEELASEPKKPIALVSLFDSLSPDIGQVKKEIVREEASRVGSSDSKSIEMGRDRSRTEAAANLMKEQIRSPIVKEPFRPPREGRGGRNGRDRKGVTYRERRMRKRSMSF